MVDRDRSASAPTYELPDADERQSWLSRLYRLAEYHRAAGRKVVVVQGLGAVGLAWCAAAVLAPREDATPPYFVVGLDLPRFVSYQNVARLNEGTLPLRDPAIADALRSAARDTSLVATLEDAALALADYVAVAVADDPSGSPLDAPAAAWHPRVEGLGPALRAIGRWQAPGALVVVASVISPERGAQAARALEEEYRQRGLDGRPRLAWLVGGGETGPGIAGVDGKAVSAARAFLGTLSPLLRTEAR